MFSTLESNWDQSAHRGRATLASFTLQALALSLVLAVSFIWVERPPQVHWLQLPAPATFVHVDSEPARGHQTSATSGNQVHRGLAAPIAVPRETPRIDDLNATAIVSAAPVLGDVVTSSSTARIARGLGDGIVVAIPVHPSILKPLRLSNLGEGSLLRRVQPAYPVAAREARIQGQVELRAIISKAGTIENLVVLRGHPMLAGAAVEAVKQWRYRPYLLNKEPVEVETNITVNFVLD